MDPDLNWHTQSFSKDISFELVIDEEQQAVRWIDRDMYVGSITSGRRDVLS
jgi:hypothetical protein